MSPARRRPSGYAGHASLSATRAAPRVAEGEAWWSQAGSNRRPLACHASALPAELWPLNLSRDSIQLARGQPAPTSGPTASLLVAGNVADDVGHVLVALFLVGDEGRIVVIVIFEGLVEFDIVFRFRNNGLDLAGIFFGIGFFQRHQFLGLGGLRRRFGGSRRGGGTGCGIGPGPGRRDWGQLDP